MGTVQAKESPGSYAIDKDDQDILLSEIPAKVQKVNVDGLCRTKNDIVTQHIQPLFSARTFEEMVKCAEAARVQMEAIGLFKKSSVLIDVSSGPTARKDGYEITYHVKETSRVTGGISTMVGTNDGSMVLQARLPNTFGRAERITSDYTHGTKSSVGYGINFFKPIKGDPNRTFSCGLFRSSADYPWSGYKQTEKGINVDLNLPSLVGQHSLRWEGVWRELACLSNTTAFPVREQAGHSLKSALKHVFEIDRRDDKVIPSEGFLFRTVQEIAGLGGDACFLKNEVELQAAKELGFFDSSVQFSLAGGALWSLKPGEKPHICDKFLLGGPLTLRGFNYNGCGPHEDGSALGADTYWLGAAHLYAPLPFSTRQGGFGDLFRTHLFFNAGNLQNVQFQDGGCESAVRSLFAGLRCSWGAGVILKMGGIARLELNYAMPILARQEDSVNKGFQFGIGIKFL